MRREFQATFSRYGTTAALILIALLMLQSTLLAQQTGMITGTVVDATGAVVPGAKISLIDQATKSTRQTTSNGEGFFTFAGVMPSTYNIKVEMKGFKTWSITGLPMTPGDKRNVSNIALSVGASADSVTVEATVSQIQVVDSGDKGWTLSAKKLDRLGLKGRDATEVIRTIPGFNYATSAKTGSAPDAIGNGEAYDSSVAGIGSAIGNGFNANGLGRGGIDLVADGAHILDPGCNCNATQNVNGDMIAEIKVSTSNFGADNAKGPIVVNAVGKSGSSQFHGNVYLHARNGVLNSKNANLGDQLSKPDDSYFYPGGQISGPIAIPHTRLKDKAFFFTGFEYYNQQNYPDGAPLAAVVPTTDMRNGNFDPTTEANKPLCDALNAAHGGQGNWTSGCGLTVNLTNPSNFYRDPTTGRSVPITVPNILPSAGITAAGRAMMSMIPLPNAIPTATNPYNYQTPSLNNKNGFTWHSRVDYNFSDNTKLYVAYNLQRETNYTPVMLFWQPPESVLFPGGIYSKPDSQTMSANFVHVFSPSLTNELIATMAYLNGPHRYGKMDAVSRSNNGYDWGGLYGNGVDIMPSLNNSWWNHGAPMMFEAGDAASYNSKSTVPTLADNLTKMWRTHTIKTGFYWEFTRKNESSAGSYWTNGQYMWSQGPWCRDIQYANPNGGAPLHDKIYNCDKSQTGWEANQIGTSNFYANLLEGITGNYTESNKSPQMDTAYKSYQAYLTDSWKVTKRLTLDYGARFEHDGTWYDRNGIGQAVFTDQWYQQDMALPVAERPLYPGARWNAIDKTIPLSGRKVVPMFVSPRFGMALDVFGTGKTVVRGGWGSYRYNDARIAAPLDAGRGVQTYTVSGGVYLQDLPRWLDSMAKCTNCSGGGGGVAPVGKLDALNPYDHQIPRTQSYSLTFSQQMPASSVLEIAYVGNQSKYQYTGGNKLSDRNIIPLGAYFLPGHDGVLRTNLDGIDNSNYRPYVAYANGSVNVADHRSYSNYNGLQVEWKRDKGWLSYALNYTWSKSLGIEGDSDPVNIDNNYGVTGQDRSHVIQANYSIDLGSRIHGINPLVRAALNGWTISGITNWQTGQNLSTWLGFSASVEGAIQYGSNYILGTPDYGVHPYVTCDPTSGFTHPNQYINGNCFTVPEVGANGPVKLPYIHGPSFFNQDMTLHKTFKVSERQNLEFRVSGYNIFNHPALGFDPLHMETIRLNFISLTGGQQAQDVRDPRHPEKPFYGQATYKNGRRVVELMIRYSF